jgi:hypothetical protein
MKKVLFTAALAMTTLFASAQFMVITTVSEAPDDSEGFSAEQITERIGIGYQVNENLAAGVQRAETTTITDSLGNNLGDADATYDIFVRYSFGEGMWATLQMPTEDATDNMKIGVGYSFNVWNDLYLEPSYTFPVNEDASGEREGKLNFGVAYRF